MPHKKAKKSIRDAATSALGYDNPPIATEAVPTASSSSSTVVTSVGVMAPKPKAKKTAVPKDKLNSFGGRKELGGLSKTAHRIFNAGATRDEYHESKKRKREEDEKAAAKKNNQKKPLVMLPYESLSAFNRRVEIALRPSIDTAIRGAKASKKALAAKSKIKKVAPGDPALAVEPDKKGKGKGPNESIDPMVPPVKPAKIRTGPTEFKEASQIRNITDVAMAPPTLKKARRGIEGGMSTNDPIPIGRMPVSDDLKKRMEFEREKAVRMYREMKEKRDSEQREEHGKL